MKLPAALLSLCYAFASQASAAVILQADPNPNTFDPDTFDPIDGGIGYRWQVQLGAADTAALTGHVGAWSWDEDSNPATAKGWTHTSNWAVVTLQAASQLTLRLERQAGIPNPTPQNPGALAGDILFPGFTIYGGYDGDGIDHHTYNNRGNVGWAEDVAYLDHADNQSGGTLERTWMLPAGVYTFALGGNSPATEAQGRQGYLATFSTQPIPEPAAALLGLAAAALGAFRRRAPRAA